MSANKSEILGMPFGTANARLRKQLMFHLATQLSQHTCFHCGNEIESIKEFSIEHKQAWQMSSDPVTLFFDIDNIAFSHLKCNIGAATKTHKKYFTEEAKIEAHREMDRISHRKNYSASKRRNKYLTKGY